MMTALNRGLLAARTLLSLTSVSSNYLSDDRNKELAERWMAKVQDKLESLERKSETSTEDMYF